MEVRGQNQSGNRRQRGNNKGGWPGPDKARGGGSGQRTKHRKMWRERWGEQNRGVPKQMVEGGGKEEESTEEQGGKE